MFQNDSKYMEHRQKPPGPAIPLTTASSAEIFNFQ